LNYAAHKHENVRKWVAKNKQDTLHFTPTSGSWMNLVEAFISIITRQAYVSAEPAHSVGLGT
jgi:transposase